MRRLSCCMCHRDEQKPDGGGEIQDGQKKYITITISPSSDNIEQAIDTQVKTVKE